MPAEQPLLRILVVEDDEDDFVLINDYFEHLTAWQCEVKWVYRYDEAIEQLLGNAYTICFSDYLLGAKNGIDLIKDIQERNCHTPVILLTGKGNYEIDIEATRAGAFDYLIKSDLNEDKLERTIRYTLERMSNLQKVKDSERKYRNLFEKSKDIIFIAGTDTSIITINFAVTDILGASAEESIGKKLTGFFSNESQADFFVASLQDDGEIDNYEADLLTADKLIKTCLISASIEVDSDNYKYMQGIIHDISSLKKAELASIQAEKLAATARFIRTLAHEVRNPLNNINLSAETLVHQLTNENDRIYLDMIERNSKRINNLITELLLSSKPVEMDIQSVALLDILTNVVNDVQDRILLRKINIHFGYSITDCFINADAKKLEMALSNIVINAIEAVEDETGFITINGHCKPGVAIVTISDNGCGMSPETKARLFEPYFTSKRNGLGLGLTTSLTILTAHEAAIEVTSQVNRGTVFQLSFKN